MHARQPFAAAEVRASQREIIALVYHFPPQAIDDLYVEDLEFWATAAAHRLKES